MKYIKRKKYMYRLYLLSTKALKPNIIMGIWYKLTVTAKKYLRTYFMQTSVHSPIQCINEDEWFSVKTPGLLLWGMSTYVWIGLTHTHQTITLFNTNFSRESTSRITNVRLSVCLSVRLSVWNQNTSDLRSLIIQNSSSECLLPI